MDNGLKFTHQGGVVIQVRGRRLGPDNLALTFTVSDSGIGFDDLDQAILYQRFFGRWLDDPPLWGLGIGLSICRQLGELIGARLAHESTRGLGSRFELSLNLSVAQAQWPSGRLASGQWAVKDGRVSRFDTLTDLQGVLHWGFQA